MRDSIHPASEENLGFLLWQVSTLWSSSTAAALKPLGLTHPQFVLLATIDWLKGKGATQEQIGKRAILDPKPTAHLLRSLEVKRLIELSDGGSEYLLTTAGATLLAKTIPIIESADAAFFASIDPKNSKIVATLQVLARTHLLKNDEMTASI
jgi:MarR family transcriptional regulator, organic hydroperoxide resistance regulator